MTELHKSQNDNNGEEDWPSLTDLATSLFPTPSSTIEKSSYSAVIQRPPQAWPVQKASPTDRAKNILVNSEGIPVGENLWELILVYYLKMSQAKIEWHGRKCPSCGENHDSYIYTSNPAKARLRCNLQDLLLVCKTFNGFTFLKKKFCPVSFDFCSVANTNMKSQTVMSARIDKIIKLAGPCFFLGRLKTRQGHGNHNRIFGLAWTQSNQEIEVNWKDRTLPLFFFMRLDYVFKPLSSDQPTAEGTLLPQLRIPDYRIVRTDLVWTSRLKVKPAYHSLRWATEAINPKSEFSTKKGRYIVFVLGSPWNLEEKAPGAAISKFAKLQPIAKVKSRLACYLVYLLKNNWCYQIVPKAVKPNTSPNRRGSQFVTGIL